MTSNVNDSGIAHLKWATNGNPLCGNRRAHIVVAVADMDKWALCIRCYNKYLKAKKLNVVK